MDRTHLDDDIPAWPTLNGRPERRALREVVNAIVRETGPDAVILFGSGARGEMTEQSDVDLLILTTDDTRKRRANASRAARAVADGLRLDVLGGRTREIERYGCETATPRGYAIAEGVACYTKNENVAQQLRDAKDGSRMAKSSGYREKQYRNEEAERFLKKAGIRSRRARRTAEDGAPEEACEDAHGVVERAAKAVLVANGKRVRFTHEIEKLAEDLKQVGEELPAAESEDDWKSMTINGTEGRYDDTGVDADDAERRMNYADSVLEWAQDRCRELLGKGPEWQPAKRGWKSTANK